MRILLRLYAADGNILCRGAGQPNSSQGNGSGKLSSRSLCLAYRADSNVARYLIQLRESL